MLAKLSIPAALAASALAGLILAKMFMSDGQTPVRQWLISEAGAQSSSRTVRPAQGSERRDWRQQQSQRQADCHRDVRTHRIGGVMVRHRHVGENCEVRVVRQSSVPR